MMDFLMIFIRLVLISLILGECMVRIIDVSVNGNNRMGA